MTINIGDTLTAVNPCKVSGVGVAQLTVGNTYTVREVYDSSFIVTNDQSCDHLFDIEPKTFREVFFKEVPYETLD